MNSEGSYRYYINILFIFDVDFVWRLLRLKLDFIRREFDYDFKY